MSYKDKLKIEKTIEAFKNIAIFLCVLVAIEVAAYVLKLHIGILDIRAIAIEVYAVIVIGTGLLAVVVFALSNKIKEDFIKKLKYTR